MDTDGGSFDASPRCRMRRGSRTLHRARRGLTTDFHRCTQTEARSTRRGAVACGADRERCTGCESFIHRFSQMDTDGALVRCAGGAVACGFLLRTTSGRARIGLSTEFHRWTQMEALSNRYGAIAWGACCISGKIPPDDEHRDSVTAFGMTGSRFARCVSVSLSRQSHQPLRLCGESIRRIRANAQRRMMMGAVMRSWRTVRRRCLR